MNTGFLEVLADSKSHHDASLASFLFQFSSHTRVFRAGGAIEFVDELWKRWREKHPQSPLSKKVIFISYAREDLAAVKELKAGLNAAGLTVWIDFDKLKPGANFNPQIQQYHNRGVLLLLGGNLQEHRSALAGIFPPRNGILPWSGTRASTLKSSLLSRS